MNLVHLNGALCSDTRVISLFNPTFLYGVNCFEGIRGYWSATRDRLVYLDLDAHLDRLYESIERIGFPAPVAKPALRSELLTMVEQGNVREDVYVRITVFIGGDGSWRTTDGIHYMISIRSLPSMLGRHAPVRLGVSRFRRISSQSMPPSIKAGANYLNSRYALLETTQRGFDDALFLTESGFVSESTGSTVFFIKGGQAHTPSLDCDLLRSITRMRIIDICRSLSIPVHERRIEQQAVSEFEAAFLAGTAVEMKPIESIDDTRFATEHPVYQSIVKELAARLDADALAGN